MVTRHLAVVVVASAVASGVVTGFTMWAVMRPTGCEPASQPRPAASPLSEEDRRKQVESFFGTPEQYDTHGGQEMRPRW